MILTLDLGTNTGFALYNPATGTVTHDTISFKLSCDDGGGIRLVRFSRWITRLHSEIPLTHVLFESVRAHKGTAPAHVYGEFSGFIKLFCEERQIPFEGVNVSTIKKHITGNGRVRGKQPIIDAVRRLGFSPKTDNDADALALLDYYLKTQEV